MKNMSNSLLTKVLAYLLMTITALTFTVTVLSFVIIKTYDIDRNPDMAFFKSNLCSDITTDYAMEAYNGYFMQYMSSFPDQQSMEDYKQYYSKENTNFFFEIKDESGKTVLSSYTDEYGYKIPFAVGKDGFTVTAYVRKDIEASDDYLFPYSLYDFAYKTRNVLIPLASVSMVITILIFIYLMYSAARKKDHEKFEPSFIDKIPFDILFLLIGGMIVIAVLGVQQIGMALYEEYMFEGLIMLLSFGFAFIFLSFMVLTVSFAARIKLKTLFRNTLFYIVIAGIFKFIWKMLSKIPLLWKLLLVIGFVSFIELILMLFMARGSFTPVFFWFLIRIAIIILSCFAALNMIKIKKGGEAISLGDLNYRIDNRYMLNDFKKHAENLNNISKGMSNAINEKMKSEHFKSELITNVSHDIRTPLTSIINYVDLLDRQNIDDVTSKEYIDILKKQSARLKKLTEDLIEASKATSGVITAKMEKLNLKEILNQAIGEYSTKLTENSIEPVMNDFSGDIHILADGRLIWRVMDNMLENICKYSQPGTRAYITVEQQSSRVRICFKNVSKYKLNISADELMERFVRGDSSRTGEGSGLGLSIAKSLTEIMKGAMLLEIEGDLFKACLVFDKA
ncbi:MAG: histidine kinase dimerization/phospho-acceptor domain-containing protein [Clostridia bacterium]